MTKSIIEIPENIKYLGEYLTDLPHNVIFDKGLVGCGGTTIAIRNNENYIIAVPFLSLIDNKTSQNPNLFGISSKTLDSQILHYLTKKGTHKIITTYDSLCRVVKLLKENTNISDYRLLIDEYHLLFTNYSFRHEAVKCVLDNYIQFKSYCFMTATVLEDDFILKELVNIPLIEAKWKNVKEVTVQSVKCPKSVIPTVNHIIAKYLNGTLEGNAYFFVNSVEFIKEMVSIHKLTDDNARAIWSKNNKLDVGLKLGKTTDSPKKINFFTSTCFEGVDLYDENAKIYIISDKSKQHTLVDISTSFQQIACRVRDTKYWNEICHIYTSTRYDVELNYYQYKQYINSEIQDNQKAVEEINSMSEKTRSLLKPSDEGTYINKRDSQFLFDENLVKIDLYNFKVTKCLYKLRINLGKEYQKNKFKVIEHKSLIKEDFNITNVFKEVVISTKENDKDYLKWAFDKYNFLELAIKHLGYNKIEELNYNPSLIQRYVMKYSHLEIKDKIEELLKGYDLSIGTFVSNETLKTMFVEIYKNLDVNKIGKANDILEYKMCKKHQKRIKNIVENGYIILK